jgi:hypothetical protein
MLLKVSGMIQCLRAQNAAADGEKRAGPGPGHAFEKSPTVNAVMVVVVDDLIGHGSDSFFEMILAASEWNRRH